MNFFWHDGGSKFNPVSSVDYLPSDLLETMQLHRLQTMVKRAYENVPLYRERMDKEKIKPEHIRSLNNIRLLPFTIKADLRDTYPFGLFASPMNEIVRLHASSGTTGKPIVAAYTKEDIDVWSNAVVRSLAACGVDRGDIIQNAYGYGLFTGGLGFHYGGEALGATVIPISGGNTDRQIMIMKDFNVTVISCTPSYFVHIIDRAHETSIDLKPFPLKIGVFGAEPWSEAMRQYIEREANIKAYDVYGLSEISGPGIAIECLAQQGLHIIEDHFYPEIINPKTLEPVPDGEEGELVLTTLSKKAMPMIRYRTRDITAFYPEQCSCGRTIRRMKKISRRSDDMFIIRGVNVFPSQIEAALLTIEGSSPHYQIKLTREHGLDQMEVQIEVTREMFSDRISKLEKLQKELTESIEKVINIRANVRLVEPNSIPRSEGKATRVIDLRQI
ncbi:MAG TPA: phenylacetate--CoA ligase [Candidatus Hydrogenedens sp.]|nr:phenylacetate--CoA ligase [Candidatus Hydrogenedens sp.]